MTYYNPVLHFGEARFVAAAVQAGVDGVIIPDLPPEEAGDLIQAARQKDLSTVFFLSPTTTPGRMHKVIRAATGFIYYVSVAGVTGARSELPEDFASRVKKIKTLTDKPICVGFGVSSPAQTKAVADIADGVIVGSAIVRQIAELNQDPDLVNRVSGYVQTLSQPLMKVL
jgi:tryptophan synthase alpha chain